MVIALLRQPLLSDFHYEFVLAFSLIVCLAAALLTIWRQKKILLSLSLLFLLPLISALCWQFLFNYCRPFYGIFLYIIFVFPALLVGFALAKLTSSLTEKKSLSSLLFVFAYLLLLSLSLIELYKGPAIFNYNVIFGYWPGSLYDELLELRPAFYWHRLLTLLFAANLLLLASFCRRLKNRLPLNKALTTLLIVTVSWQLVIFSLRYKLHFYHDNNALEKVLSAKVSSPNIKIFYSPKNRNKKLFEQLLLVATAYRQQISEKLDFSPTKPLKIYFYQNQQQRAQLIGSRHAALGNPINRSVHFIAPKAIQPMPLLRHELVHILAAELSHPPFYLSKHLAISEGLAETIYPYYSGYTDQQLAAAILHNSTIDYNSFFKYLNFWRENPNLAYPLASSFVSYLIETYGLEKFKILYKSSSYNKAYDLSLKQLIAGWKAAVNRERLSPAAEKELDYLWKVGSIFKRSCPRATADFSHSAKELIANKRKPAAIELLTHSLTISGQAALPFFQLLKIYLTDNKRLAAEKLCTNSPENFPSYYQNLVQQFSYALKIISSGKLAAATAEQFKEAIATTLTPRQSPWQRQLALTRLYLLKNKFLPPLAELTLPATSSLRISQLKRLKTKQNLSAKLLLAHLLLQKNSLSEVTTLLHSIDKTLLAGEEEKLYLLLNGRLKLQSEQFPAALKFFEELRNKSSLPGMKAKAKDWLELTQALQP